MTDMEPVPREDQTWTGATFAGTCKHHPRNLGSRNRLTILSFSLLVQRPRQRRQLDPDLVFRRPRLNVVGGCTGDVPRRLSDCDCDRVQRYCRRPTPHALRRYRPQRLRLLAEPLRSLLTHDYSVVLVLVSPGEPGPTRRRCRLLCRLCGGSATEADAPGWRYALHRIKYAQSSQGDSFRGLTVRY